MKMNFKSWKDTFNGLILSVNRYIKAKDKLPPVKLKPLIDKIKKYDFTNFQSELNDWLSNESEWVNEADKNYKLEFGSKLEALFYQNGMKMSGQYPLLYSGLYKIELSFERGTAAIYWGPEFVARVRLTPNDILKSVVKFNKELLKDWSPDDYFTLLSEAYKRVKEKVKAAALPLNSVLSELVILRQPKAFWREPNRKNFREYSRARFGYDLYRLRESKYRDKIELKVATFDQTLRKDALFVPDGPSSGTRFSSITLKP